MKKLISDNLSEFLNEGNLNKYFSSEEPPSPSEFESFVEEIIASLSPLEALKQFKNFFNKYPALHKELGEIEGHDAYASGMETFMDWYSANSTDADWQDYEKWMERKDDRDRGKRERNTTEKIPSKRRASLLRELVDQLGKIENGITGVKNVIYMSDHQGYKTLKGNSLTSNEKKKLQDFIDSFETGEIADIRNKYTEKGEKYMPYY